VRADVGKLEELEIADVGTHAGRGLRCSKPGRAPMLLELGADPWSRRFGQELQERAGKERVPPPEPAAVSDSPGA
jgi:hypothetical protein